MEFEEKCPFCHGVWHTEPVYHYDQNLGDLTVACCDRGKIRVYYRDKYNINLPKILVNFLYFYFNFIQSWQKVEF